MQRARRRDPYPFMWEIPLGVAVTVALVLLLGAHLGRALANLATGGGWSLTARAGLFTSLFEVIGGEAGAGLQAGPGPFASAPLLWTCIAVTELLLLVLLTLVAKACLDRWGPWRMRGTASRAQAERLLGLTRLRKVSGLVRPDLYGKTRRGTR